MSDRNGDGENTTMWHIIAYCNVTMMKGHVLFDNMESYSVSYIGIYILFLIESIKILGLFSSLMPMPVSLIVS